MKVIIDCQVLNKGKTGVGRYLQNLLSGLKNSRLESLIILYSNQRLKLLNLESINKKIRSEFNFLNHKILSIFWLHLYFPILITKEDKGIVVHPNNVMPLLYSKKHKNIVIIHDLFSKISNEYHDRFYNFYFNFLIKKTISTADLIIANSENTKNDILKYYNVTDSKVRVIYPCIEQSFRLLQNNKLLGKYLSDKFGISANFLLYVGRIEKRKNINAILKVAEILKLKGHVINVVLVGKVGYQGGKILKEFKNYCEDAIHLEYVDDADLIRLYNSATVFLFPSLYEGFGYPPLEAMQCGCPVIVSRSSSLPEVVGDEGLMFDPQDHQGMANAIIKIIKEPDYKQKLIERGIKQAKKFNCINSAEQFLSIIDLLSE